MHLWWQIATSCGTFRTLQNQATSFWGTLWITKRKTWWHPLLLSNLVKSLTRNAKSSIANYKVWNSSDIFRKNHTSGHIFLRILESQIAAFSDILSNVQDSCICKILVSGLELNSDLWWNPSIAFWISNWPVASCMSNCKVVISLANWKDSFRKTRIEKTSFAHAS